MSPTTRLFTVIAAVGALTATAATAQPQGPGGSGGQVQQPDLSSVLRLRPDQQGAYAQYRAGIQPSPAQINQIRASHQGLAALSTPARLDRIAMALQLQMDVFQRSADATRAFYGQLSPDQQRTFDQVTAPPAGRERPQS